MKKIYWRPRNVSRMALLVIAAMSIGGLLLVEFNPVSVRQPHFEEKMAASALAAKCMESIKEARLELGHDGDPEKDPAESGMIGVAISPVTSTFGMLQAKQLAVNPNFAAVVVEMLKSLGVSAGDTVGVSLSGSFPALNVAVVAALETLHARPICISSAAASQWGANLPDFLWLDMESVLYDEKLISFRSLAATLGGVEDRGLGMDGETLELLQAGIDRAEVPLMTASDATETFSQTVDKRMQLYAQKAAGNRIKAYINVGGGTTSVGKSLGKRLISAGTNYSLPKAARDIDSVITRFLAKGVPVIHLVRVEELAKRYGLNQNPEIRQMPEVGEGRVYYRQEYNRWYAVLVLGTIMVSLYAFIRSDWGFRVLQQAGRRKELDHPEPMI